MVLVLETIVLDQVMLFGTDQIQIFAISSRYEEIRHRLLKDLEAGVTMALILDGYSYKLTDNVVNAAVTLLNNMDKSVDACLN